MVGKSFFQENLCLGGVGGGGCLGFCFLGVLGVAFFLNGSLFTSFIGS